jgi:hypothetical protein
MSWIILEGLDRTGKSSVAELYKKQGYEVIHMSAPDKKYKEEGYTGPSYIDDILEIYMSCDNKDVVFDRSVYGEFIWPYVYNRDPHISEEDIEILQDFEQRNSTQKLLMVDPNQDAHWSRCVENKEPLTRQQFVLAGRLFDKLAHSHNFIPRQLNDFKPATTNDESESVAPVEEIKESQPIDTRKDSSSLGNSEVVDTLESRKATAIQNGKTQEQQILEKANAINSILSKRIIKQKGEIFDLIETDIKEHLNKQLKVLFNGGTNIQETLTKDEVMVLRLYAQRILDKQKERT